MIATSCGNFISRCNDASGVDAETLSEMIAAKLGTVRGPRRDGVYSIDTGVWRLYVGDDPSPDAPCGISWSLDGPDERGERSGGWEMLPKHQAAAEAATLAGYLARDSARRHPAGAGGLLRDPYTVEAMTELRNNIWSTRDACLGHYPMACPAGCANSGRGG